MSGRLEHADMREAIPRLVDEGIRCDACVTDPPYHLKQIGRSLQFTKHGDGSDRTGARCYTERGFMGQQWDGGDIAFRPETWAAVASILRPGAFLVAFGGTRTHHRVWCAIEDAGFVIQDTIMWLFATGFPKRRDHLKPAYEPICLAYKPGGTRTMQIDECRIGGEPSPSVARRAPLGRWPANVVHDGSDEMLAAFPESAGQQGDIRGTEPSRSHARVWQGGMGRVPFAGRNDTGSCARFFFSAKSGAEDRWGSRHPTVKPVALIEWLVKLVCPPGGTFIDPFAGSGTAAVAALRAGRNAILVEREARYAADIGERIAFYEGDGRHSLASKARAAPAKPAGPLFALAGEAAE